MQESEYRERLEGIAELLRGWPGPVVVASHEDPDGDAVSSTLGLTRALRAMGKEVTLVVDPPPFLQFALESGEAVAKLDELPAGGLLVALDTNHDRITGVPLPPADYPVINIDHHGTNPGFGMASVVEPGRAACALMIKELIDVLGVPWDRRLGEAVYIGIVTDTGSFRFSNTDPRVFLAAADLVGLGLDVAALNERLQTRPRHYFLVLGAVMRTVEYHHGGRSVLGRIGPEVVAAAGVDPEAVEEDSEDFVGYLRYAEGVLVAAFLKDRGDKIKVSLRSRGAASAQRIAVELGGGGHPAAAGATLAPGLPQARRRVLEAIGRELERHAQPAKEPSPTR